MSTIARQRLAPSVQSHHSIELKFRKIPSLPDLDLRTSEYVYFVESDTPSKLIKVGKTEGLKKRLLGLQMMCPVQLRLIAAIRAPAGTEWLFHRMFSRARLHGEWFLPTTEVIEVAKGLPKLGSLLHADVRELALKYGCPELQITAAFMRSERSKRRRPKVRYGQLVFK